MVKMKVCVLFLFFACFGNSFEETGKEELDEEKAKSLSDHIRLIMEHYKQPDPVGLPGAPIPDPLPIPDMKYAQAMLTLNLMNATVHGLSKFKVDQLYSNLANMQVDAALKYRKVEVLGNYTMTRWFAAPSAGAFNVSLVGVYFEGVALLEVARFGNLEATDINLDITFDDVTLDFKNLTFLATVFQGMINTVGIFVFDSIKPYILKEVNTNLRGDLNKNLKMLKQTFPNSIPPLDLAIAELRKYVRNNTYDPYKIPDYSYSAGIVGVDITEIWLTGLASFFRVGNVTISVSNHTIAAYIHMSTKKLRGQCKFEASGMGFLSRTGSTSFSIEHLEIETKVNQSLNVRKTPILEELRLELGNMQLRMDGLGTVDYLLELMANILPNILRYQIIDAIEVPLKQRIQDSLNLLDIEKEINAHLKEIDELTNGNMTSTDLDPRESLEDDFFEDVSL